jgi:uncharacterized repeat protein (TIGR01451 family)
VGAVFVGALVFAASGKSEPQAAASSAAPAPAPAPKWDLPTIRIEPTVEKFPAGPVAVGDALTYTVTIANKGKDPIKGFNVVSAGLLDAFVVTGVAPSSGTFETVSSSLRARFVHEIAPGESASAKIMLRAKTAGNHTVTIEFEGHGVVLVNAQDEKPHLGGQAAVVP